MNLYICSNYKKCVRRNCPHKIVHKYIGHCKLTCNGDTLNTHITPYKTRGICRKVKKNTKLYRKYIVDNI